MPTLEPFCTITAEMAPTMLGAMPDGFRIDFPFTGTATSSHWEGELPVVGTDHGRVRKDGTVVLDITARIGEGSDAVFYTATGLALPTETRGDADPHELIMFETANEDLAFLNRSIGVAFGESRGTMLTLEVYLAKK